MTRAYSVVKRYRLASIASDVQDWKRDLAVMLKIYLEFDPSEQNLADWKHRREQFDTFMTGIRTWVERGIMHGRVKDNTPDLMTVRGALSDFWRVFRIDKLFPSLNFNDAKPDWDGMLTSADSNVAAVKRAASKLFKAIEQYAANQAIESVDISTEHFEIGGVGIVIKHMTESDKDKGLADQFLRKLKSKIADIKRAGFPQAVRGLTVTVDFNPDVSPGANAVYQPTLDTLIMLPNGLGMEGSGHGTFTHEIGHRFWFKQLPAWARDHWVEVVSNNTVMVTREHCEKAFAIMTAALRSAKPMDFALRHEREALFERHASNPEEASALNLLAISNIMPVMANWNDPASYDPAEYRAALFQMVGEKVPMDAREEISEYGSTDPVEGFAEAFRVWVTKGPNRLGPWTRWFFTSIVRHGGAKFAKGSDLESWLKGYAKRHPKLARQLPKVVSKEYGGGSSSHPEARQAGNEIQIFPKFWGHDLDTQDWIMTHELGHYVLSGNLGRLIEIASKHGVDPWDTGSLPYSQFNMDEAFADCFAAYHLAKSELSSRYPQWKEIIEEFL